MGRERGSRTGRCQGCKHLERGARLIKPLAKTAEGMRHPADVPNEVGRHLAGAVTAQGQRDTRDALTRARAGKTTAIAWGTRSRARGRARPRQLPDEAGAPEYRTSYFQRIIYV